MLCLQIKCRCGHFGRVFDRPKVMAFERDKNPGVKCSKCGAREGLDITRAWWNGANALDGARADTERQFDD